MSKYVKMIVGFVILIVLYVPIYQEESHCCGHPWTEDITIAKHFVFGKDPCLVYAVDFYISPWIYFGLTLFSLYLILSGVPEKKEMKEGVGYE